MKKIIASIFLFLLYSQISFGIEAQEIEKDVDKLLAQKNESITCPMFNKSCELKINITSENFSEDEEDFSVTEVRGVKYFTLINATDCYAEKQEYTELDIATMCISIEPILIGEGIIKIRNRKTNSTINVDVYITKPQSSLSNKSYWTMQFISVIQTIIIASFLDTNFPSLESIRKSKLKLFIYLIVVFIRTITMLIVSLSFYYKKGKLVLFIFIQ